MLPLLYLHLCLTDFLLTKLDLEGLILDFLGERVVLTVVLYFVQLLLIAVYAGLGTVDVATLHDDGTLELVNLGLDVLHTGVETCDLVLEVLHFERKLATQGTLLVDSREGGLQLVESLQFLFYRKVCWIFLCHNVFIVLSI